MPTINLEMIKKLLEEFSEKEALTTEEINVIEKEISSLEERITFCHNKLKNLGSDKERLVAMKERYVKGNFSQYIQATSSEIIESPNPKTDIAISQNLPAAHLDSSNTISVSENKTPDQIQDQSEIPSTVNEPSVEETSIESDKPTTDTNVSKDGNEPIKSINEALKGLFRK